MKKITLLLLLFSIDLLVVGCKVKIPNISSVQQATFKLDNFLSGCTKRQNGQGGMIDFKVNMIVWVHEATGKKMLSNVDYISDPTVAVKLPIYLKANLPTDGTISSVQIEVTGVNCSNCANGWSSLISEGTECKTSILGPSIAAKPRWEGGAIIYNFLDTINLTNASRYNQIFNVPNTCGCVVNP